MADHTRAPDTGAGPSRNSRHRTPRWVTVVGLVVLAVVLLVVVAVLTGGGEHGPGRHASGDDTGRGAPAVALHTGADADPLDAQAPGRGVRR